MALARLLGVDAPAMTKGVSNVGWPCRAISMTPMVIGTSYCRLGVLVLMMEKTPAFAKCSSVSPRAKAQSVSTSSMRWRDWQNA